jgi:predicted transcriptional regulator
VSSPSGFDPESVRRRLKIIQFSDNRSIFVLKIIAMLNREKVKQTIDRLPEVFTVEQVIEELLVLNKIEEGLRDIEEGRVYTTDQIKQELKAWLR